MIRKIECCDKKKICNEVGNKKRITRKEITKKKLQKRNYEKAEE